VEGAAADPDGAVMMPAVLVIGDEAAAFPEGPVRDGRYLWFR
jgi:hypothetical protein